MNTADKFREMAQEVELQTERERLQKEEDKKARLKAAYNPTAVQTLADHIITEAGKRAAKGGHKHDHCLDYYDNNIDFECHDNLQLLQQLLSSQGFFVSIEEREERDMCDSLTTNTYICIKW